MKQLHALPGVRVDGIDPGQGLLLSGLQVIQRLDAPSQCEISWSTPTPLSASMEQGSVAPGNALRIYIEGQPAPAFSGEVAAVEYLHDPSGAFTLRLRAYDVLGRLQRQQTVSTHVEATTAELARTLAGEAGLTTEASTEGPVWPRIVPRFPHDLALLREYTERSGLHFVVQEEVLRLFSADAPEGKTYELTLGKDLFEARLERNAVRPVNTLRLLGWDPHTGEPRQAQSRYQAGATAGDSSNGVRTLLGAAAESDDEAESLLAAELARSKAVGAVLWGVAEGDVSLTPGRQVKVSGVAKGLEGPYLLRTVVHTLDAESGYICELDTRPEPADRSQGAPALIAAEVCDVDDPEARGRVQVSLDSFADALSTWMMVLQLGAGSDKGMVVLPEVGDRVLVALPDGDPSRGVVLGGLFHRDGPPPDPEAAQNSSKHRPYTLVTRGGQRIRLNDADGSIRLENAEGSYISLTPDGLLLHAEGELIIEAPGKRLILGADRIDMQRRS